MNIVAQFINDKKISEGIDKILKVVDKNRRSFKDSRGFDRDLETIKVQITKLPSEKPEDKKLHESVQKLVNDTLNVFGNIEKVSSDKINHQVSLFGSMSKSLEKRFKGTWGYSYDAKGIQRKMFVPSKEYED